MQQDKNSHKRCTNMTRTLRYITLHAYVDAVLTCILLSHLVISSNSIFFRSFIFFRPFFFLKFLLSSCVLFLLLILSYIHFCYLYYPRLLLLPSFVHLFISSLISNLSFPVPSFSYFLPSFLLLLISLQSLIH